MEKNAISAINVKLKKLSVAQLKNIVLYLDNDFRQGSDIVYQQTLSILAKKLGDSKFHEFCQSF